MASGCAIWIILFLFFHSLLGEIHQLYSPLSAVIPQRTHACIGELLTFTCDATGSRIEWDIATVKDIRFFPYHKAGITESRSGVTALLLEIRNFTDSSGEVLRTNFNSILFINVTNFEASLPADITCSSDTTNSSTLASIARQPEPPKLTKVLILGTLFGLVYYQIEWREPSNINYFDLDHYELTVGNHTKNIHGRETSTNIAIATNNTSKIFSIIAVDRCGSASNVASAVAAPDSNSTPNAGSQTDNCRSFSGGSIGSIVLAIILMPAIIISLIIGANISKICCRKKTYNIIHSYIFNTQDASGLLKSNKLEPQTSLPENLTSRLTKYMREPEEAQPIMQNKENEDNPEEDS